jgi:hypothetical protein
MQSEQQLAMATKGPTHPPVHWLLGSFFQGVMRPAEADHSPPNSTKVEKM